jgi:four helix bundle protein
MVGLTLKRNMTLSMAMRMTMSMMMKRGVEAAMIPASHPHHHYHRHPHRHRQRHKMTFSHDRLDVYNRSIAFVAWAQRLSGSLPAAEVARPQLERASTSIPLNIAEGNSKSSKKDRARYWKIALGSTFECAAILDVLVARGVKGKSDTLEGRDALERIAKMLMGLLRNLGAMIAD